MGYYTLITNNIDINDTGGPDYQNSEVFNIEAMKPYPAYIF